MKKEICFDMDGTIADLYSVNGWLDMLRAYDATPYLQASPLVDMIKLATEINRLQKSGWIVKIISWLSKEPTKEYDEKVTKAKKEWLAKYLPSVTFDEINIVAHSTPKSIFGSGILFDDEEKNRMEWNGIAFNVDNILEVLSLLN